LEIPKIEKVGFPNDVWEDIVSRRQGLVLITGITGAGKSTTIASLIDLISEKSACRIITVEDPIEYVFQQKNSMISQREVGRDVDSFADGLRSMLREDPDVIFVGEMRDPETIMMTLMAAETGHLVFSTLHTRDVTGTITRVLDYFPSGRQSEVRNQLSLGLRYIITGKIEQIYTQLQTRTKDKPDEKMITLERHLAMLVKSDQVDLLEARKWANNLGNFVDALKQA
ncbi:MAG: type IV pilus twitching motility protein PilT, partial [Planctomycetota bacterium]